MEPAGQGVQVVFRPTELEKEPAEHRVQLLIPSELENVPARHAVHVVTPVVLEKEPAEHEMQPEMFCALPVPYLPAAQFVQVLCPELE